MKNSVKPIFLFTLSFFLFSCGPVKLSPANISAINNIGVISIIGDDIVTSGRVSVRLMFSKYKALDIAQDMNWNMNDITEDIARKLLEKYGSKIVTKLDYDYKKLNSMQKKGIFSPEITADGNEAYLNKIIAGKNIDTLLIISKCYCSDFIGGNSNDAVFGYGVYRKHWGKDDIQYASFSAIKYTLIDAKTFKTIASKTDLDYVNHENGSLWDKNLKSLDVKKKKILFNLLISHIVNSSTKMLSEWELIKPNKS